MTPNQHEHVDLREYVDVRIDAVSQMIATMHADTDKRFEAVNEFRQTLADEQRTLMPRFEYEQAHNALVDKIEALGSRLDDMQGNSRGMATGWGLFAAILAAIVSIVSVIILLFHVRGVGP